MHNTNLDRSVNNPAEVWCNSMLAQSLRFAERIDRMESEIAAMRADVAAWRLELRAEFQDETTGGTELDAAVAAILQGET